MEQCSATKDDENNLFYKTWKDSQSVMISVLICYHRIKGLNTVVASCVVSVVYEAFYKFGMICSIIFPQAKA